MSADDEGRAITRRREAIAYHEAGHAVVGQTQGLRVSRVYPGAASGRVIFDDE